MTKPISMILIGAGNRGRGIFGQYALDMPHKAKFVGVVEPDKKKRQSFADKHSIPANMCFSHYNQLFECKKKLADAVIIATLENERVSPVLQAIDAGYHLLVEKPLGTNLSEVIQITDAAKDYDGIFMVCHQMRYIPLYFTIKKLIDSKKYGNVVSIQHSENLSYFHMAHSFVRGFFNSSKMTPMILAKSCHDMDILCWLTGKKPLKTSSFGSLNYFKSSNAPNGSVDRCLDGCAVESECPYSALKLYFGDGTDDAYLRQIGVISGRNELMEVLKTSQFGRCVYKCDNDVVDNQVVQILFEDNVTANFSMCGLNAIERRITKISLDNGEIECDLSKGTIWASSFTQGTEEIITPKDVGGTHNGGDQLIMNSFVDAISSGDKSRILTSVGMSLDSHLLALAAEKSRLSGSIVDLSDFEAETRKMQTG